MVVMNWPTVHGLTPHALPSTLGLYTLEVIKQQWETDVNSYDENETDEVDIFH